MSRLIPDSTDRCRCFCLSESERDFLLCHSDLYPLFHHADGADAAPFRAIVKELQAKGSVTPVFAAKLMAMFCHRCRRRAVALYRKKHPKRTILTLRSFMDEEGVQ